MKLAVNKLSIAGVFLLLCAASAFGQPAPENKPKTPLFIAATPAYAELLLKKTEVQSELESLSLDYTDEFPKLKEGRQVALLLDRDIARISRVKSSDVGKLTEALGKLMIRRIELETDLLNLLRNYKDEHPDVKRAKRKVEIYDSAISEILN